MQGIHDIVTPKPKARPKFKQALPASPAYEEAWGSPIVVIREEKSLLVRIKARLPEPQVAQIYSRGTSMAWERRTPTKDEKAVWRVPLCPDNLGQQQAESHLEWHWLRNLCRRIGAPVPEMHDERVR